MDVSKTVSENTDLGGEKLLEAVVSLSGLPANLAYGELNEILQQTGQTTGEVTLESLRAAMLMYLQELNDGMEGEMEGEIDASQSPIS